MQEHGNHHNKQVNDDVDSNYLITDSNNEDDGNGGDNNDTFIRTKVKELVASRYDIFRQIDRQCIANDLFRQLDESVPALHRDVQAQADRIDSYLTDQWTKLEKQKSDDANANPNDKGADKDIDRELNVTHSKRNMLSSTKSHIECQTCKQRIAKSIWSRHVLVCSALHDPNRIQPPRRRDGSIIYSYPMPQTETDSYQKMSISIRPHPPRNLRVVREKTTHDSFTIAWDPSILDGGEVIADYEVVYHILPPPKKNKKGNGLRKRVALTCSRWCNVNPVPDGLFTLEGLEARTTYGDIKLRCRNKIGWSEYCPMMVEPVTTLDPIQPLPPQRFRVATSSSHSIQFEWSPPFDLGGGKLKCYELGYIEPINTELQQAGGTATDKKVRFEKRTVQIPHDNTSHTLEQLKGNTTYSDFHLVAISSFGLQSDPVQCDNVTTKHPSRLHAIEKEIEWVKSTSTSVKEGDTEFVDTDFFQPGIVQREEKAFYLAKLEEERLKIIKESGCDGANEHDQTEGGIGDIDEDSGRAARSPNSPSRREKNFIFRINAITSELEEYNKLMQDNMTTRFLLIRQMADSQNRIINLKSELKVISELDDDEFIASSVLNHGAEQKFRTEDLRIAMNKELEDALAQIETWKSEIIVIDRTSDRLNAQIERKEELLRDRKAAFVTFKKQKDSSSTLRLKSSKLPKDILRHYFSQWKVFSTKVSLWNKSFTLIHRMNQFTSVVQSFSKWRLYTRHQAKVQSLKKQQTEIKSRAGNMLIDAEMARADTCTSIMSEMQSIYSKSISDEKSIDLSLNANEYELSDDYVKGELYSNVEDFAKALDCYKRALKQIQMSGSNNGVKKNETQCVLGVKIGRTLLILKSFNEALLYFDNVLHQAREIKIERFIAIAHLNLAECYRLMGSTVDAKLHYFSCLNLNDTSDVKYIRMAASRGLEICKESLGHSENMIQNEALFDTTDHLRREIRSAVERANELEARIVNVSIECGKTIEMEQVSSKSIQARRTRTKLNADINTKSEELAVVEEELRRLPPLISSIELEIVGSSRLPHKSGRKSTLIHDSEQIFEKGELQERLRTRLLESRTLLETMIDRDKLLRTEIRNLQDVVSDIEEDLRLEGGLLMQKVLKKRHIRLMAFNVLRLIDETGEDNATNLIAVTMDKYLYIHDLISGEAVQVFDGDENNGHTKIITSLFFQGDLVFTGSMDRTVCCWSIEKDGLQYVCRGHDSTVSSICATTSILVSGSADKSLICWNKISGLKLHRLYGHVRGIITLCEGPSSFLSGDADGEVCIWSKEFKCRQRLRLDPIHKVTVIKSGKLEAVTGDSGGFITVFWLEDCKTLQKCKAHNASVTDLHFDAIRIVSTGMDCCIKIIDITTCQVLHSIVNGHSEPILSCLFDSQKIMSLSKDWSIKHWLWESPLTQQNDGNQYHSVVEGDDLKSISKQYQVSIYDLIKWNREESIKSMKVGQKLIVKKAKSKLIKSDVVDDGGDKQVMFRDLNGHQSLNVGEDTDLQVLPLTHDVLAEPSVLARRLMSS